MSEVTVAVGEERMCVGVGVNTHAACGLVQVRAVKRNQRTWRAQGQGQMHVCYRGVDVTVWWCSFRYGTAPRRT